MPDAVADEIADRFPSSKTREAIPARTALGALCVALGGALIVPGSRIGLGLALTATAVIAAASVGRREVRRSWQVALLLCAAFLAATPLLRDATWLVFVNLIGALVLTAIALTGGHTWKAAGRAVSTLLSGAARGPGAVLRGALRATGSGAPALMPAVRAGVLATALLAVFALLFSSADSAFAHLFGKLSPDLSMELVGLRSATAIAVLAAVGSLALVAASSSSDEPSAGPTWRLAPLEWIAALTSLVALFAVFVAVQLVVLFGGDEHVLSTAGLTYAEYAREGFGQLLISALLVLALAAVALRHCRVDNARQQGVLTLLLIALCLLTLMIVASGVHRLDLYVDAFGATRARLLAGAGCAWVAGVLVLLVASLARANRSWLPRAVIGFSAALLLVLTIANPDARIAERNVERYEKTGSIDRRYSASLSADAVPALADLPPDVAEAVLSSAESHLREDDGLWGLNLAREEARQALHLSN